MAVIGQAEILLTANTARFTTEMARARLTGRNTASDLTRGFNQMAQESQRNASLVTRSFNEMANVARDLKNTLAGVVIGGGIVAGLDKIKTVSDAMKSLDTQVKLVTASEAEYLAVRQQVRGIADYVHNDIQATTLLYTNSARALGNMGKSQQDVLKFTKAVSLAMAVGGKSANEQAAAILQLGQAMQSGVVQGDEFRSISENAPVLLDLVAEKLGKTRGEVRAMSKEGKITAEVMYNALAGAVPKLEADYSKVASTMAGAWQVVKNKTAEGVGDFANKTGGISDTIANQMLGLADGIGATFDFIRQNGEQIKGVINTTVGVVAVTAFAKLGASALATVPSLTAQAVAMANSTRATVANATSSARLGNAMLAIVTGHTPAQMAIARYTQAVIGATVATANYVRGIPAMVAGLRATATSAMASATSINALTLAKRGATAGAVLMGRGVMGIGSALSGLASLINRHPLLMLAGVLATVLIGTEGLKGAMQSLSETVGVTGVIFENFAKGAVEGISLLAKDAVEFFNSFSNNSQKSTATANGAFGGMFTHTEKGLLGIMQVSASIFDKIGSHVRATALYGVKLFSNMFTAVHNGFVHMGNGITSVFETIANAGVSSINFILGGINQLIAGVNQLPANFGGGQAITPITPIADVKFKRGETLAYDNSSYGDILKGTETTGLRDVLDGSIKQYRIQTKVSEQTTGAMVDLTKVTKAQTAASKAEADDKKKGAKAKKDISADYQLAVYEAWKKAGLSEQQAKIMTAEVGRENSYNPNILFGYHKDASNGAKNAGMLSWQKDRATNLERYLVGQGLLQGGKIQRTQASLDAMAKFAVNEILNNSHYARTKNQFLANPNIDTQTAFAITGDNYIKWDRSGKAVLGETGAAKHAARRDNYYRQISAKAGLVGTKSEIKDLQQELKTEQDLAQQQADLRLEIERDFADKKTQLAQDYQAKVKKIESAGFDDKTKQAYLTQAKTDYDNDVTAYDNALKQKLSAFTDFKKTEAQLAEEEYTQKSLAVSLDKELTDKQKVEAIKALTQERDLKIKGIELVNDKERQTANASHQTAVENIKAEHDLQRRELELDIKMDSDLRKAKLQAINDSEEQALAEARQSFEAELSSITDYSKTEIQRLNEEFINQRNAIDRRTDIDDTQKGSLRNALAGKHNQDLAILRKPVADDFNSLNADMSGTSELLNLQNQLNQRLEIIKKAKDAEVIATEQAEQAKARVEMSYAQASHQLHVGYATGIVGTVADMGKTMFGETSRTYKTLFALSQSFVMAQAGLNMYKAISDGWATGATLPQKLAAAAMAGTEMLKIITAAQQIKMQGFATGGYTGDIPVNAVAGLVHGGEYVFDANATKAIGKKNLDSLRKGDGMMGNTTVNVNVTVNSDGSSSVDTDKQLGKSIGEAVNVAVQKALLKERRQGGSLSR